MTNTKHQTLIITGASKGIGHATAALFIEQGYRVVNLSRSSCDIDGVINLCADLSRVDWLTQHQDALLEVANESQTLCLIHNAALLAKDSVVDIEADNFAHILQLNVIAVAQLNALLLPYMKVPNMQAGSSVLYVGSTLATKAVANSYSYVISKHAMVGQMRATCQDLISTGIHTACVCPGFTDTQMLRSHIGTDPETETAIAAGNAMKRLVAPEEIAQTLWFCSQNSVINGALIHANLGQIES